MEDFDVALAAFVETYRNQVDSDWVAKLLRNQAEQVEKDEGWVFNDTTNPQPVSPTLTAITPNTAVLGSEDVTMVCTGTDFTAESVIIFAGQPEPIVFVSDTEISTVVKPSLGWGAVTVQVTVKNGTLESEPQDFTFTESVANRRK